MELAQALDAIKKSIAQGELEEAYQQLVALLEMFGDYAELADIARVNQADFYQVKAQILKGIISDEDARLANNQLADKALQIIRQLETGKISFEQELKPASSKALRYYLIGGIGALAIAFILWLLLRDKEKIVECPVFSPTTELKVMILPFKQTGTEQGDPAFDIMDGLNDYIEKTPGLRVRALADVHEEYDIEKDYPNSAQAVDIARNCGVQMLVWGKIKQFKQDDYIVDVRYRLLDAGGVRIAGDTTLNRLLTVTEEANWINDVQTISSLLYLALANQMQVPIAANILENLAPAPGDAATADSLPPVDTSTSFVFADQYLVKKEVDKAIAVYDQVLEHYPGNATAHQKRGALLYQKQDYSAAARDLECVTASDEKTSGALREARFNAYIKSSQPEKAKQEIESARKDKSFDDAWLNKKSEEVQDSTAALQIRRDDAERLASTRTRDADIRVEAAKTNLGLGETNDALRHAREAIRIDPKNREAVQIVVDAHLEKGDTAEAAKTIESAERAGVNVKKIFFTPAQKVPLTKVQKKQ